MTAGMVKAPVVPRCGCCDARNPVAKCDRCHEPMCAAHFVRLTDGAGERKYVCTICAEIELSAYLRAKAPTPHAAVAR